MWQYHYVQWIGALVAFVLPAVIGYLWGGWESALGACLVAGVARVVDHMESLESRARR